MANPVLLDPMVAMVCWEVRAFRIRSYVGWTVGGWRRREEILSYHLSSTGLLLSSDFLPEGEWVEHVRLQQL
jgi:hypothetical protein